MRKTIAVLMAIITVASLAGCKSEVYEERYHEEPKQDTSQVLDTAESFKDEYTEENVRNALAGSDYISNNFDLYESTEVIVTLNNGNFYESTRNIISGYGIQNKYDSFSLSMRTMNSGGISDCAIAYTFDKTDVDKAFNELVNIVREYTTDDVANYIIGLKGSEDKTKIISTEHGDLELSLSINEMTEPRMVEMTEEEKDKAFEEYKAALENNPDADLSQYFNMSEDIERVSIIIGVNYKDVEKYAIINHYDVDDALTRVIHSCLAFNGNATDMLSEYSYYPIVNYLGGPEFSIEGMNINYLSNDETNLTVKCKHKFNDGASGNTIITAAYDGYKITTQSDYYLDSNELLDWVAELARQTILADEDTINNSLSNLRGGIAEVANGLSGDIAVIDGADGNLTVEVKYISNYGYFADIVIRG